MNTRLILLLSLLLAAIQGRAQSTIVPYTFTTIAGEVELDYAGGYADGTNRQAQFNYPEGVAVDTAGNLYVADLDNHVIRKITPVGTNWVVSTLAGQPGTAGWMDALIGSGALFNSPRGVAVDNAGNVYVADTGNNAIRMVTPSGEVSTVAGDPLLSDGFGGYIGGYQEGSGSDAWFDNPTGVAVDAARNLYVADFDNNVIRKLTKDADLETWESSTLAGSSGYGSGDGQGLAAQFNGPRGVAVDAGGNVYVADTYNNAIRKITPDRTVSTIAGSAPTADQVEYFDGGVPYPNQDGTGIKAGFFLPYGVAVDSATNVYVADSCDCEIRKVTPQGVVTTLGGVPTAEPFVANGDLLPLYPVPAYNDGPGSTARFYFPVGIAVDGQGNLYVGDTDNCVIRKGVAPVVQVVALEVTQVIQDWSNSIPLVQNKETYVRAHLQLASVESGPVMVEGAVLYGTMWGYFTNAATTPINPGAFLNVTTGIAASDVNRGNILNSLDFRLPASWLSNSLQLQLAWPGGLQPTNVVPNNSAVPVTFIPMAVPQIAFFDVQWTSTNGTAHQLGNNISTLADRVLSCYPVASVDATYHVLPIWFRQPPGFGNDPQTPPSVNEQLRAARDENLDVLTHRIWFGAIQALPGAPIGRAISPPVGSPETTPTFVSCANVMNTYGVGRQSVSHELGHNLGLPHDVDAGIYGTTADRSGTYALGGCGNLAVNCVAGVITPACGVCIAPIGTPPYPLFQSVLGYDHPKPTLGPMTLGDNSLIYGLDTLTLRTTSQSPVVSPVEINPIPGDPNCYYDLMSYCRNGGPEERWPSSVTYLGLLNGIKNLFGAPAPTPKRGPQPRGGGTQNYLLVRGSVDFIAGTAQFLPCLPLAASSPPPSELAGTNFTLEALDAKGEVLQTAQFALQPDIGEEGDTNQIASFHLYLTATPAIHTLVLSYNGGLLATLTASAAAPTLTLTSPNGGQNVTNGTLSIAWTGSDPNGDTLVYTVQYSADDGATWETLAVDWQDQSLDVDSSLLSATTQGLMRVIASDGLNTASAQSAAPFTISPHPPAVSINAPLDGSSFQGNQQLFLDARASDMQDGALSGTNVQWHSNIDGPLGTGPIVSFAANHLSEGYHTITVTAVDSAGLTASAAIHLLVLHYPPPHLNFKVTPGLAGWYAPYATLSWPAYYTNYVLQGSRSLTSAWAAMTNPAPSQFGSQQTLSVSLTNKTSFFRLVRQ